jgi:hypothetical protein
MAQAGTQNGDFYIFGNCYVAGLIPLPGAAAYITDVLISATAAIDSTKVKAERQRVETLANYGATPAAVRKTIGRCRRTSGGTIVGVVAGLVQPLTVGSLTVDVLKNGTTILAAPIALNTTGGTGGTAYDAVAGTLAVTTLAAGDTLEVVVAVTGPTGGGGLYVELLTKES